MNLIRRWASIVTHKPHYIIIISCLTIVVCMALSLSLHPIPSFSKPLEGIAPRGTDTTGRSQAMRRVEERLLDKRFYSKPDTVKPPWAGSVTSGNDKCLDYPIYSLKQRGIRRAFQGRLLLKAKDDVTSMFSLNLLKDACEFETKYVTPFLKRKGNCEWGQSLYLYATSGVAGVPLTKCDDIKQSHIDATISLVKSCMVHYEAGRLGPDCLGTCRNTVPSNCTNHNTVYKIVNFMTDSGFMSGSPRSTKVTESLFFLRDEWFELANNEMRDYFINELDKKSIDVGGVQMRAAQLNTIDKVLTIYTLKDLLFFALSMVIILILLYIYLRSLTMMLATMTNVTFAICSAYFFFFVVFRMEFFPFMNIVAGLLVIAIGADGVFILYDLKEEAKVEHPEMDMVDICEIMLRHGGLSILVTSLTTSAAVFTNFSSNITSLRCFGIFGGTCVLTNLVFLMSFVPAVIMLLEKYYYVGSCMCCCVKKDEAIEKFEKEKDIVKWPTLNGIIDKFWRKQLPVYITKMAPFNIVLCSIIGIGGLVMVYGAPKLKVQEYRDFQIFPGFNQMEAYRWVYQDHFRFEQQANIDERAEMDMQFVWGFDGKDKGDLLDPDSLGVLEMEKRFNFFTPESQLFLQKFCTKSKLEDFIRDANSLQCFMDIAKDIYESACRGVMDSRCCGKTGGFPMTESIARICYKSDQIPNSILLRATIGQQVIGQTIYDNVTKELIGFRVRLPTTYNWTNDYSDMKNNLDYLNSYSDRMLANVKTDGLDLGWLIGYGEFDLDLFDLQDSLKKGMFMGIVLSIALGFIVLLITSLNIVLTIYAIITIIMTIGATMASLVILGWQVTLFDSIVISLAVGLSIDFSIHYGIGYKLAEGETKVDRVQFVIKTIGSAVAMAAITTFGAGTMCYFGYSVVYTHFGTFLMIVMMFAWVFGTFFFMGILSIIGPSRGFGEIPVKCLQSSHDHDITKGHDNSTYIDNEGRPHVNTAPRKHHEMKEHPLPATKGSPSNKVEPDV